MRDEKAVVRVVKPAADKPNAGKKLSFRDQKEIDGMPDRIARLENEQEELCLIMADPDFYKKPADEVQAARVRSDALAFEIVEAYRLWEELEQKARGAA